VHGEREAFSCGWGPQSDVEGGEPPTITEKPSFNRGFRGIRPEDWTERLPRMGRRTFEEGGEGAMKAELTFKVVIEMPTGAIAALLVWLRSLIRA